MARASILWLIGEYCERVPKIAPDVLRKMAKAFTCEEEIVKLQTLNLAAKLYLTNAKQVKEDIQQQVSKRCCWNGTGAEKTAQWGAAINSASYATMLTSKIRTVFTFQMILCASVNWFMVCVPLWTDLWSVFCFSFTFGKLEQSSNWNASLCCTVKQIQQCTYCTCLTAVLCYSRLHLNGAPATVLCVL